jgi:predicted Zn-dependent peptidase
MYFDQPSYSVYEAAKQAFFAGHPLGKSVLGTPESITALTRDQMYEYFRSRYVASNITAVVAGNFAWENLVAWVSEHCGDWNTGLAFRLVPPLLGTKAFQVVSRANIIQEHAFLLSEGPPANSAFRHAAEVLATVVGDDTGSRLYWALEDPGLLDAANMDFHEYDNAGTYYTYLSGDTEEFQQSLEIACQVLDAVQSNGVTEEELQQAKSKLGARMVRGSERPMGRMQALGYYWTYLKKYRTVDEELQAVDAVTTRSIRELLERHPVNDPAIVALGPLTQLRHP